MGRWPSDARARLERAALALFTEQGFAATTVPQITARAGLTTRTFFRHFTDKREVLFAGEAELPAFVARVLADAPPSLGPLALIAAGISAVAAARFDGRREELRIRRAVIDQDEGLRERELRKLAVLAEAIDAGFRDRGLDPVDARLAADLAVTVFRVSVGRWLDQDGDRPLAEIAHDTLARLQVLSASGVGS